MKVENKKICFFDSGIGGLTLLNHCIPYLKGKEIYYYGDNANAPYGNLSLEKIERNVIDAFKLFEKLNIDIVVVACNTVTTLCINKMRKLFKFKIIGTEPSVCSAVNRGNIIYVLSTRATYNSFKLEKLCLKALKINPLAYIKCFPLDGLAGALENYYCNNEEFLLNEYLPLGHPDVVVLGCTHYVFLKKEIKEYYNCKIETGYDGILNRLLYLLDEKRSCCPLTTTYMKKIDFLNDKLQKHSYAIYLKNDKDTIKMGKKGNDINTNTPFLILNFIGSGQVLNEKIFKKILIED